MIRPLLKLYEQTMERLQSLPRLSSHGKLDAAFVALPLQATGLVPATTGYTEALVAVVPKAWRQALLLCEPKGLSCRMLKVPDDTMSKCHRMRHTRIVTEFFTSERS